MSVEQQHSLGGCLECLAEIEECEAEIKDLTIRAQKAEAAIRALLEDYDCKNEVMPAYYQALDALGEKK